MEWEKAGAESNAAPGADWSFSPESLFTASAVASEVQNVRRAETAPTIMTELAAMADDDIPESEAYRCTQEYHNFYYSQMPRDPRMPIPIKSRNANTGSQQPQSGSSTSVGSGAGSQPATSPWVVQKSSLTGDIVSHPHTRMTPGSNPYQQVMPGRVVTPATAQQMLNDPHAPIPHGSRVVYVTEPPKAVTPSTIYVLLPEGTAPPPGATVIHAPPSFLSSSGEPSRVGSGVSHLVSANGQILIATTPSPPNQFHSIPHIVAGPHPSQGPSVVIGVRAPPNHPLAPTPGMQYRPTQQFAPPSHHSPNSNGGGAAGGTAAPIVRHPLLQQYIDTKLTADWNVRLIVGHIPHFCRDQDGSRFIQRQLDESGENVPHVWNEAFPIALELMCDVFGNYVIQKLFEVADEERRIKLVGLFRGNVMKLSMQTYGCRVLQKAFDSVPSKHVDFVANELQGKVAACVFDQNANHVVQKCIEKLASKCQFVADEFLADLQRLACHAYGCRVLQKLFEACYYSEARGVQNPYAPTDLTELLTTVFTKLDELVVNQFGNYVVQHGMMNCSSALQAKYIDRISPQVFVLSKSKFGSNVAEKAVELASEAQRGIIIDALLGDNNNNVASPSSPARSASGEPPLVSMMRDPFANYVVQKLMDRSSPDQQTRMVHVILPHVETIAQATFGKHLLTRMDKMGLLPPAVAAAVLTTKEGSPAAGGNTKNQPRGDKKKSERTTSATTHSASSSVPTKGRQSAVSPATAPLQLSAGSDAAKASQTKSSKRTHRRQRSTASSGASTGTLSAKPTPGTSPATLSLSPPSHSLGGGAANVVSSLSSSAAAAGPIAPRVMQHMPYRSPTTDVIAQQQARHSQDTFSLEGAAPFQQTAPQQQQPALSYNRPAPQQQHQQPTYAQHPLQQQQYPQQHYQAPTQHATYAPHQSQYQPQQQQQQQHSYSAPTANYQPAYQQQYPQQQQQSYGGGGGTTPSQFHHYPTSSSAHPPQNSVQHSQQQQQRRQDSYPQHYSQQYPPNNAGAPSPSGGYSAQQHTATSGGGGGGYEQQSFHQYQQPSQGGGYAPQPSQHQSHQQHQHQQHQSSPWPYAARGEFDHPQINNSGWSGSGASQLTQGQQVRVGSNYMGGAQPPRQ